MKKFEYADGEISEKEIMIAVPSMVIGVGILSLPKNLAVETIAADGWISIAAGGLVAVLLAYFIAKLAASFPGQPFITYASKIVTKPVAIFLTFLYTITALQITSSAVRGIADISKQYLFDRTPVEVIALAFLLVVIYAVSGSRVGLFRLNMMFFPIILFVTLTALLFNLKWFQFEHLLPMFETDVGGYARGIKTGIGSYVGVGILWFYISLVKQPKKTSKMAVFGMCIPVVVYLFLFVLTIGVFGNSVTTNLLYPTVELAKSAEIPGEFFERFESIFFVIWIMAIFNTTALAMDIAVFTLTSIFKNTSKLKIIFIIAPIIYLAAMIPQDVIEVETYAKIVSYSSVLTTLFTVLLLYTVAKIRGVKGDG